MIASMIHDVREVVGPIVAVILPYIKAGTYILIAICFASVIVPKSNIKLRAFIAPLITWGILIIALAQGSIAAFLPESSSATSYIYMIIGLFIAMILLLGNYALRKMENTKDNDENE